MATAWCSNKPVQIKHHSLVRVCLALERSERGARVAEIPALLSEHRRGNSCEHPGKTVAEPLCCVRLTVDKKRAVHITAPHGDSLTRIDECRRQLANSRVLFDCIEKSESDKRGCYRGK